MGYLKEKINSHSELVCFKSSQTKKLYFDYIINSINGYDLKEIEEDFSKKQTIAFLDEYKRVPLARVLNILSFQIKNGRNLKYTNFLYNLLQMLIEDMLSAEASFGADFLMIEIYFILTNLKGVMEDSLYQQYIEQLIRTDPFSMNQIHCRKTPVEAQHNFVIYSMVGEYLRSLLTGTDSSAYILENWNIQKNKFDLNGMYIDPDAPMLYDLTVRAHLALMLHLGYEGEIKNDIEVILMKSSMITLFYLSSSFIFPYGGRSNSYHMNETLFACLCEYYAIQYKKKKDFKIAGAFKRAARKSVENLIRWEGVHLKNFYDIKSGYGCDYYGTYEAYMVTAGCFLEMGYIIQKKRIREYVTPSEFGGYFIRTTEDFHKVFANCKGYFVEIDYQADSTHESNGLGRIHFKKAPIELMLSMPFSKNPAYLLNEKIQNKARAVGPGWIEDEKEVYLAEQKFVRPASILGKQENRKRVSFEIIYHLKRGNITESYLLDRKGVHLSSHCDFAPLIYHLPVFISNGKEHALQTYQYNGFTNSLNGYLYQASWSKKYSCTLQLPLLYNRNGEYKSLVIQSNTDEISINVKIKKEGKRSGKTEKKK